MRGLLLRVKIAFVSVTAVKPERKSHTDNSFGKPRKARRVEWQRERKAEQRILCG